MQQEFVKCFATTKAASVYANSLENEKATDSTDRQTTRTTICRQAEKQAADRQSWRVQAEGRRADSKRARKANGKTDMKMTRTRRIQK